METQKVGFDMAANCPVETGGKVGKERELGNLSDPHQVSDSYT